jgi:pimeloyl-ACP methyl ester carboxylesterase
MPALFNGGKKKRTRLAPERLVVSWRAQPKEAEMNAKVNGIQMAYTDEGAGRTLLLVHGFPLNRHAWSPQVAAFRKDFRVVAPDLRGLGESEGTAGAVAMVRYAEDLQALMVYLGTGPVILAGHSMGGYVALAFARAFPQALRGLVLVGTRAGADAPAAAAARRASAEQVRADGCAGLVAAMAAKMLSPGHADPAMAAAVRGFMTPSRPEGVIAALLGMAERPDAGGWLGQIRVPTLVVAGAEDTIIAPAESESLAKAIPGAQLKLVPQAGHLVAFEQAEAFNAALGTWLELSMA